MRWLFVCALFGCGNTGRGVTATTTTGGTTGGGLDLSMGSTTTGGITTAGTTGSTTGSTTSGGGDAGYDVCVAYPSSCYTIYAHGDHELFKVDLMAKTLQMIGPFNAPQVMVGTKMVEDTITDLAVATDDTIYVVSKTNLYTADPNDGHVTLVGGIGTCGGSAVAMTFTDDGKLYVGDHKGAFCTVDPKNPSSVTKLTLSNNFALSGDLVAIGDGTMYGSATILDSKGNPTSATASNNILIKIDPATATATQVGSIGYKNLFGLSYAGGQVFGFTHDCSGNVVTINPKTGAGTPFNVFPDPMPNCTESGNTGTGLNFAGAGVNAKVQPGPVS